MDEHGEPIQILNKSDGIADNAVRYQFEDRQKGLWLATNSGISRAELLSPYHFIR